MEGFQQITEHFNGRTAEGRVRVVLVITQGIGDSEG